MSRFHGFHALIMLNFLYFVDLLHFVQNVLELLHKVASADHNQFALASLTDCREFDF